MDEKDQGRKELSFASGREKHLHDDFVDLFKAHPLPDHEILANLGLFVNRSLMQRMLYMSEVYRHALEVHGFIAELGVRWGQNLALFSVLRTLYEPWNHHRRIIGFDTFEGFPSVAEKDGGAAVIAPGSYNVTPGYEEYLEQLLLYHEALQPRPHLRKHEIVKGDASVTVPRYLEAHPEAIFALVSFDMDVYKPTRDCLEALLPRLVKGCVILFDELAVEAFPGETRAVCEVLGVNTSALRRTPNSNASSYMIFGE